jgi:hypothetical protein
MKPECEKCLMPNKSKEWCIKRQCAHADMPPPPLIPELPESKWHFDVGDTIGDDHIKINVTYKDEERGFFNAQVVLLKDKNKEHGHFGSYVTKGQYYCFTYIGYEDEKKQLNELIWEVKEEGTDRFHREGSTGAQFLLYWFPESGFSFDLDT